MPNLAVQEWPLEKLIEYADNPRKNDHAVDQAAAAIKQFGFRVPILVKSDGLIIDGHLRLKAARQLGLATVPVLLADDMTDAQVKAFRLSVNKISDLAEWDDELLAVQLDDLRDMGFGMDSIGFAPGELNDLIGTPNIGPMPGMPDGDKAPFQQMTFTLHDTQAEQVSAAMDAARAMGPFVDSPNENGNGNALARICETYLTEHANG